MKNDGIVLNASRGNAARYHNQASPPSVLDNRLILHDNMMKIVFDDCYLEPRIPALAPPFCPGMIEETPAAYR